MINLKENNDVHVNADMLQRAREVRELHERLRNPSNHVTKVMLDRSTSPDIRVTSRDVDNAERWLEPCVPCLEGKMIAREQARVWGGPDAMAVGDMICLDLIQGEELSLGGNIQLLIGRDVYGYGFVVGMKNKQTDTIMTACVSIKIMLESYGHQLGMLLFDSEPVFKSIQKKKSILGDVRVEYTPPGLHNKRAERFIREVKEKINAIRAGLLLQV